MRNAWEIKKAQPWRRLKTLPQSIGYSIHGWIHNVTASLGGEPWGNTGETTVVSLRATSCQGPCVPSALFPAFHRLPPHLFHHKLNAVKLWAKISYFSPKCLCWVLWPWRRGANGYGKSQASPIGSWALDNILRMPLSAGDLHAWLTCFFWKT